MPGPKSTSSASSRGANDRKSGSDGEAEFLEVAPPKAASPHERNDDDDDDDDGGIPLSVLHMISNKDHVRNDVDHADLFARLREHDEAAQRTSPSGFRARPPPSLHGSSASSAKGGEGGRVDRRRRRRRARDGNSRDEDQKSKTKSVAGDDDRRRESEPKKHDEEDRKRNDDRDDENKREDCRDDNRRSEEPLSPRSALRRKGVLLQELYMHIGQINSQTTVVGSHAPIRPLDMSASLEDVEVEVERAQAVVNQIRALKFMRKGLVTVASAAEFSNKRFNPWPLELDGFADFLTSGMSEYDGCFIKLYNKHKGRSQELSPEMELLMLFGSSAFMFHLSKSFAKTAMANTNFTAAVANAMAAQHQQQQQQQQYPPPTTRSTGSTPAAFAQRPSDTASVAGTTISQQYDEALLVDRLKKAKMLPENVTKLVK
jgi:hypothetical protein